MEIKAGSLITQIKQISGRIFDRILSDKNIDAFNGAQGNLLYVLWQGDNITLGELSRKTGLATTTLTSMVDRMEAAGLVNRTADPKDRRKTRLLLTDKAKGLRSDYNDVSERMSDIFYSGFSEEEIRQFEHYLERVLLNLRKSIRCYACSGRLNFLE